MASGTTMLGIALMLSANTNRARSEISSFVNFTSKRFKDMYAYGRRMSEAGIAIRDKGFDDLKTGVAALAPGIAAAKSAMNLESKIGDVAKTAGVDFGTKQFQDLKKQAMDVGEYLGRSSTEVAELMSELSAGGVKTEMLGEMAKKAGEIGVAFGVSAGDAGNAFMTIQNAMGLTVEQTGSVMDAMNAATNKFGGKAPELLNFMAQGGAAVARNLKISGEQMQAFGNSMQVMGVSSSEAATTMERFQNAVLMKKGLRKIFDDAGGGVAGLTAILKKARDSGDAVGWLKGMGAGEYSTKIGQMAMGMFDEKGLLNQLTFLSDQKNIVGSAYQEFLNKQKGTQESWNQLMVTLQNVATKIGDKVLPELRKLFEEVKPILKAVGGWVDRNRGLVKAMMVAVGVFGALKISMGIFKIGFGSTLQLLGQGKSVFAVMGDKVGMFKKTFVETGKDISKYSKIAFNGISKGFSAMVKGIGSAARFLMANPIILIIAAIAALAYVVYRNWDKIKAWFANLWVKVKKIFSDTWEWLKQLFLNYTPLGLIFKHWDKITQFFKDLWQKVKNIFSETWEWIKSLFNPAKLIKDAMSKIKKLLPDFLTGKHSVDVKSPAMALAGVPAAASISSSRSIGTTNHFAPVINLSGGATQADANRITDTMRRQFDRMSKDQAARQQRVKF